MKYSKSNLPHEKFLNSGIKLKELSQSLQTAISELDRRIDKFFNEYTPETDGEAFTKRWSVIEAQSEVIKGHMEVSFVEKEEKEPTYSSKDDRACYALWKAGKREGITIADFEAAGGDTGFYSNLGRVGFTTSNFSLTKKREESTYTLKMRS